LIENRRNSHVEKLPRDEAVLHPVGQVPIELPAERLERTVEMLSSDLKSHVGEPYLVLAVWSLTAGLISTLALILEIWNSRPAGCAVSLTPLIAFILAGMLFWMYVRREEELLPEPESKSERFLEFQRIVRIREMSEDDVDELLSYRVFWKDGTILRSEVFGGDWIDDRMIVVDVPPGQPMWIEKIYPDKAIDDDFSYRIHVRNASSIK
jgi:hypothetical protein